MSQKRQTIAIIQKDLRSITANKRMLAALLVVPIVLTVVMPSISLLALRFLPEDTQDMERMLALLPLGEQTGDLSRDMPGLLLNYVMPTFFLLIPIMAASVMAAVSFVGEKEKRTLETLLYCPLSLRQVFRAKVLAAFSLSELVSLASFGLMLAILETETILLVGAPVLPGFTWVLVMLLVSPALSLIAVTLIVRVSAKAKSVEDAQQGAVFLILPVILLGAGQFSGLMLISPWMLLGIGLLCAVLAAALLRRALGRFTYEALLERE